MVLSSPPLFPPGRRYGLAMMTYDIPMNNIGTPYSPKSKRPMAMSGLSPYRSSISPATTRFVLVPIRVHVPPSIEANDNGISSCDGAIPTFFPHFWTIGIMITTTGVLFKKAEIIAIGIMRRSWAACVFTGCPSSFDMYQSRPPVSCIPAATTKSTSTVRTPSLENPLTPSGIVTMFAAMHRVKAESITKSAPNLSDNNAANIIRSTTPTYIISHSAPSAGGVEVGAVVAVVAPSPSRSWSHRPAVSMFVKLL
mmetsp:Transcript_29976/g.71301  ORF Transcript_29976/g.71301 Transcript_29976/m.71301 type:complete len:253 (+) Transcript_29976:2807-3565(+)